MVWPESSVPWSPVESYDEAFRRLRSLTADGDQYLLFGNDDREGEGPGARIYVGAKLLAPSGDIGLRHHKQRLVPFGEYVPLAPLFTLGVQTVATAIQEILRSEEVFARIGGDDSIRGNFKHSTSSVERV